MTNSDESAAAQRAITPPYYFTRVFAEELFEIDQRRGDTADGARHGGDGPAHEVHIQLPLQELCLAYRRCEAADNGPDQGPATVDLFIAQARLAEIWCRRTVANYTTMRQRLTRMEERTFALHRRLARSDFQAISETESLAELARLQKLLEHHAQYLDPERHNVLLAELDIARRRLAVGLGARKFFLKEPVSKPPDAAPDALIEAEKVRNFQALLGELSAAYRQLGLPALSERNAPRAPDSPFDESEMNGAGKIDQIQQKVLGILAELSRPEQLAVFRWAGDEVPVRAAKHSPEPMDDGTVRREKQLRDAALCRDTVGLALSGGGIRSATVGLGVLQALAYHRLLGNFDYLSTVSGGGYIGSWLAAWILRDGSLEKVERQLDVRRYEQATARFVQAGRGGSTAGSAPVRDDEPAPIRHLRRYSNYLTPRTGLISPDSWTILAIYLRNWLLNQLVLVPALFAILLAVQGTAAAFSPGGPGSSGWYVVIVGLLGSTGWVGEALRRMSSRLSFPMAGSPPISSRGVMDVAVVIPCVVLAVFGGLAAQYGRFQLIFWCTFFICLWPGLWISAVGFMGWTRGRVAGKIWSWICRPRLTIFSWLKGPVSGIWGRARAFWRRYGWSQESANGIGRRSRGLLWACWWPKGTAPTTARAIPIRQPIWWFVGSLLAGTVGAIGANLALQEMHDNFGELPILWTATEPDGLTRVIPPGAPFMATFAPPAVLILLATIITVMIGLCSRATSELAREWWASFAGRLMLSAAVWLALFGMTLYGPWILFGRIDGKGVLESYRRWITIVAGSTWFTSTVSGLLAGWSARTNGRDTRGKPADLIARIAPPVFLAGIVILGSWLLGFVPPAWLGGSAPQHLPAWWNVVQRAFLPSVGVALGLAIVPPVLGYFIDVNKFSLHRMYTNRLVRCYLGASRTEDRRPDPVTGLDVQDDLPFSELRATTHAAPGRGRPRYAGPYHLVTAALNLVGDDELAWQERKAESFVLSPGFSGCRSTGYRDTRFYAGKLNLGTAVGISGAAVSPNMGYHSSPGVTALLTVFNIRLGEWLGNPFGSSWQAAWPQWGPLYIVNELLGRTNRAANFLYLSDGGHFENLGVYELIRRRCRYVVLIDSGADPAFQFEDLGNLVRKVNIDFGIRIEIDPAPLVPDAKSGRSRAHVAVGRIIYSDASGSTRADRDLNRLEPELGKGDVRRRAENPFTFKPECDDGMLIYIKPSLTGDEPADVTQYAQAHSRFPHEPTSDQFFSESQFESYRALGFHVGDQVFSDPATTARTAVVRGENFIRVLFDRVYQLWLSQPTTNVTEFLEANREYIRIHQALRQEPNLCKLSREILDGITTASLTLEEQWAERHLFAEMMCVMEDAWYRLQLSRWKDHPLYDGWDAVVWKWTGLSRFLEYWTDVKGEFSVQFRERIDDVRQRIEHERRHGARASVVDRRPSRHRKGWDASELHESGPYD